MKDDTSMAEGSFTVEFVLGQSATPEDLKSLGNAIWGWYDDSLTGSLTQYYIDGGDGTGSESKNFKGQELAELREGKAPASGRESHSSPIDLLP